MTSPPSAVPDIRGLHPIRIRPLQMMAALAAVTLLSYPPPLAAWTTLGTVGNIGGPGLTKADTTQLKAAARKLLQDDKGAVGASESWANPTSGRSGTLTVQAKLTKKGYDCRTIQSNLVLKSGKHRSLVSDVCAVPGKGWKIVS